MAQGAEPPTAQPEDLSSIPSRAQRRPTSGGLQKDRYTHSLPLYNLDPYRVVGKNK